MRLPLVEDAAIWFVDAARAAVAEGRQLDAPAVELLLAFAPDDPIVPLAIERLLTDRDPDTLASAARQAIVRLGEAVAARDAASAREIVTTLETRLLSVYRPVHGLGRFEDDVAVALAMIAAYDVGADETHLMMAEELMLGVIRRYWRRRREYGLQANCEAAVSLAALAGRTGKAEYRARALEVMVEYASSYRDHGVDAAPYISALRLIR